MNTEEKNKRQKIEWVICGNIKYRILTGEKKERANEYFEVASKLINMEYQIINS